MVSSATPPRATNTFDGSLIQISSTSGVVEVLLQRPETGHRVQDRLHRPLDVGQRGQATVERALVIVGHRIPHQPVDLTGVPGRVEAGAADELAHLGLDVAYRFHPAPSPGSRTSRPASPPTG